MIADAHNHLNTFPREELETVLTDARSAGVELMVAVGMDPETSAGGVAIADAEQGVYAAVGLHPWPAVDHPDGVPIAELRALAAHPKVVAIGEIGLDFYRNKFTGVSHRDPELQRIQESAFREQLGLARTLGLPVILHSVAAHDAVTRILADEGMDAAGGCVQLLEGTPDDVARYVELGFSFSIGSSVTFPDPGGWYETVRAVPADRLLLESDAPYLPYEGKESGRSAPDDVRLIGTAVAELRGEEPEQLLAATAQNLRRALPRIGGRA